MMNHSSSIVRCWSQLYSCQQCHTKCTTNTCPNSRLLSCWQHSLLSMRYNLQSWKTTHLWWANNIWFDSKESQQSYPSSIDYPLLHIHIVARLDSSSRYFWLCILKLRFSWQLCKLINMMCTHYAHHNTANPELNNRLYPYNCCCTMSKNYRSWAIRTASSKSTNCNWPLKTHIHQHLLLEQCMCSRISCTLDEYRNYLMLVRLYIIYLRNCFRPRRRDLPMH